MHFWPHLFALVLCLGEPYGTPSHTESASQVSLMNKIHQWLEREKGHAVQLETGTVRQHTSADVCLRLELQGNQQAACAWRSKQS